MKKILFPLLCCLMSGSALAETTAVATSHFVSPVETVSVSGLGKVTLTPDRAIFTVGVQTIAATVDAAVQQNNSRAEAVIAALKAAGAIEQEIRTQNFSISPQQEYVEGKAPRVSGYMVSNDVTVTRDKIDDAGKLLQAAINAGVNQASGLSLSVADQTRGRDEALQLAFQDARAKAEILARAAQRTLGRAISISEGGAMAFPPPQPFVMERMQAMDAKVSEVPVAAGTQEVSFAVSVVFELQ